MRLTMFATSISSTIRSSRWKISCGAAVSRSLMLSVAFRDPVETPFLSLLAVNPPA